MELQDVLVVNAGSTSVKTTRIRGGRERTGEDLDAALHDPDAPAVVVHRVVHGGERTEAELLDDDAVAALRALTELAPLHQPAALDAIDRCRDRWPNATQLACFDTAFHAGMPVEARTYALPRRLRDRVQVYGFHGLSHAWASSRARGLLPGASRVLVAHLGGGQSLCGVLDGRSVVTTMGFTPLDGLVMATRSGTVDPGAVLYLARHTDEDLDAVFESESGLLGLTGSADMSEVLQRRRAGDADAVLGIDVWLHRFLRQAGGCIAVLGGLDALVFTGGVGEHAGELRALVADRLAWAGVDVRDDGAAPEDVLDLSATGATVRTLVVHAREDLQMLREARRCLPGHTG
jgi:acetate kinase